MGATDTKGIALVKDVSSGISSAKASRRAKPGYDLILVARNRARLAALGRRIEDESGRSAETNRADLNDRVDPALIEMRCR